MAEVWAAQHEGLRSEVAIKFVDATLASDATTAPYALERFRFEAQISAKISAKTRHVVAVHDAGENEGVPYLVMELVNGHTLEDEVERCRSSAAPTCSIRWPTRSRRRTRSASFTATSSPQT